MIFKDKIQSIEELRSFYDKPNQRSLMKQLSALDIHSRAFIALSPFFLMATADFHGNCDVSPRGDAPGFVRVINDMHIAFPDRPGNNRLDSLSNLIENPRIGMLFLIPGRGDTLRVNGKAWILRDEDLLSTFEFNGKKPKMAVGVEIEEVYLHCPRAFTRSGLWRHENWSSVQSLPKFAEMLWEQFPEKPAELKNAKEYEEVLNKLDRQNLY